MAKHDTTESRLDETQEPPPKPGPIQLDGIGHLGATEHGVPVKRIAMLLADGRTLKLDLPIPIPPELSEDERTYVLLFRRLDPERRLKQTEIANLLDYPLGSVKGPLSKLVKLEILESHVTGGYSRGVNFPTQ